MINLTHSTQTEIERIERERTRHNLKLEKKSEKEIEDIRTKVKKEIDANTRAYNTQIEELNERHYKLTSGEMFSALREDYALLQARSKINEVSKESMDKARRIKEKAEKIGDSATRAVMLDLLKEGVTDEVRSAMECISGEFDSIRTITSYIAADRDEVKIIIPVKKDGNNKLATDLESRLTQTLGMNEILLEDNLHAYDPKQIRVLTDISKKVNFTWENFDESNGFLIYSVKPSDSSESHKLATGIVKRINAMQPETFKEAKVRHEMQVIDANIIDYFKTHTQEEFYSTKDQLEQLVKEGQTSISYEDASKITGKAIGALKTSITRGTINAMQEGAIELSSLINYLSEKTKTRNYTQRKSASNEIISTDSDIEVIKQKIYARLTEVSQGREELNSEEIKYIFGCASSSFVTGIARRPDIALYVEKRKDVGITGPKRLYFKVEGIQKYLNSRMPTKKGRWKIVESESKTE